MTVFYGMIPSFLALGPTAAINGNDLGADLAAKIATKMGLNFAMRVSKLKGMKHRKSHPTRSQGYKIPKDRNTVSFK